MIQKWHSIGDKLPIFIDSTRTPPPPPKVELVYTTIEEHYPTCLEEGVELRWWYAFQNDPMGVRDFNPKAGIGHFALIQAPSLYEATDVYRERIRPHSSTECDCCGPRWTWELDKDGEFTEPQIYPGVSLEKWFQDILHRSSILYLHYWDGAIIEIKGQIHNEGKP